MMPTSPTQARDSSDLLAFLELENTQFVPSFGHIQRTIHTIYRSQPSSSLSDFTTDKIWIRGAFQGGGTYGTVWMETLEDKPAEIRAVKEIEKRKMTGVLDYKAEIRNMARLSKYEGSFVKLLNWFSSESTVYLAMEYHSLGDLSRYITADITEGDVKLIASQLLVGLQIMHKNGLVHRDLKPAVSFQQLLCEELATENLRTLTCLKNILVVSKGPQWWVKIGDFGFAKEMSIAHSMVGTDGFQAPELIPDLMAFVNGERFKYDDKVDIWSLGCILFQLSTYAPHNVPFLDSAAMARYCKGQNDFPTEKLMQSMSDAGMAVVQKLLEPKPSARWSADRALASRWFKGSPDMGSSSVRSSALSTPEPLRSIAPISQDSSSVHNSIAVEPTHAKVTPPPLPPRPSQSTAASIGYENDQSSTAASLKPSIEMMVSGEVPIACFSGLPLEKAAPPSCDICKSTRTKATTRPNRTAIYICSDCGDGERPLHEDCARQNNDGEYDEHEADHWLAKWAPTYTSHFERYLRESQFSEDSVSTSEEYLGTSFRTDLAFRLGGDTCNKTVFILQPPPGEYRVVVGFHFEPYDDAAVNTLGFREALKFGWKTGSGSLGHLKFCFSTAPLEDPITVPQQWPPVAGNINLQEKEPREKCWTEDSVVVEKSQVLLLCVEPEFDSAIFNKFPPFKWWLDTIRLEQVSPKCQLGTSEELRAARLRREEEEELKHRRQMRELELQLERSRIDDLKKQQKDRESDRRRQLYMQSADRSRRYLQERNQMAQSKSSLNVPKSSAPRARSNPPPSKPATSPGTRIQSSYTPDNSATFNSMLRQYNELQAQTQMENFEMQKAQAFWNPLQQL